MSEEKTHKTPGWLLELDESERVFWITRQLAYAQVESAIIMQEMRDERFKETEKKEV